MKYVIEPYSSRGSRAVRLLSFHHQPWPSPLCRASGGSGCGLEVVAFFEVGDESGVLRVPVEPLRARECLAHRLDGAQVDRAGPLELREVVDERGVDDAVGRLGAAAQAVEVLQRAAVDLG